MRHLMLLAFLLALPIQSYAQTIDPQAQIAAVKASLQKSVAILKATRVD